MYIAKREELMRRRLAINLNKKELSLKAGLPANAIGRIEKGENEQTHPNNDKNKRKGPGCLHDHGGRD